MSVTYFGVQAKAEVHSPNIQMGPFVFSNVQRRISNTVWTDATGSLSATSPYHASGTASNFTAYGP